MFVDVNNGQLSANHDRIDVRDGKQVVPEVNCLSVGNTMSPLNAVQLNQKDGPSTFLMINQEITITEKHQWYYQVKMQMAVIVRLRKWSTLFWYRKFFFNCF